MASEKERADRNFEDFERVRSEMGQARADSDNWMQAFHRLRTEYRQSVGRSPRTKRPNDEDVTEDENDTDDDTATMHA